jgi:hypothetical protein
LVPTLDDDCDAKRVRGTDCQSRSATGKRSLRSKSLTGRRSCIFRRTGVCLHRTGSGGNRKKSKLIFDSLQTRDRRGWFKNGNQRGDPQVAPRCGAKTRRGNGCQAPAMPNGRCRMHGGTSTGPRTAEGLERCRTAKLKHGWYGKAGGHRVARCRRSLRLIPILQRIPNPFRGRDE